MNEPETKTCPLCCESVHARARKCPHCQHYLNKWVLVAYHPLLVASPLLILLAAAIIFLAQVLDRGENFDSYRSQVHVTHSEMQFGDLPTKGPTVAVVGTIQNNSPVVWKDLNIEVQFFDKSHKLIDTKQTREYLGSLQAKDTCAFKVSQPREFSLTDYASYEVRILGARDGHSFLP